MKSPHQSLLLLLAAISPISAFAHSAVEPAPRADQGWKDRQELLNKRATEAGDKAQVIFIGDSITQGWEGEGKEVWAKYYAQRNAVNLGIGGDRTQHVLWRLDHGNLDGLKPRAAVVMIGTNNSNGEDNTVEQIADGVAAIVKQLREKLPQTKVLLLAIFPRSENPSPQRGKILQVNQIVQKLADDQSVFWIDFGYKFVNRDGTIPHDLMPDYLHLSRRGYEIWAEAIEDRLSAVLGDTRVKAEQSGAGVSPAGLRVCLKMRISEESGESAKHNSSHGDINPRFGTVAGDFIVANQAALFHQPAKSHVPRSNDDAGGWF